MTDPVPTENARLPIVPDRLAPWIDGIRTGDDKALEQLYDATVSRVIGLANGIVGDRDVAQEVALLVYEQVWQRAASFDPSRGQALTWLLTITRSRAIDVLRARGVRGRREQPLADQDMVDDSADPELSSRRSEDADVVREALATLSPAQQRAIQAAFFHGLSHSEVAATLGQPLGTIKGNIRRGLIALRKQLHGRDWSST